MLVEDERATKGVVEFEVAGSGITVNVLIVGRGESVTIEPVLVTAEDVSITVGGSAWIVFISSISTPED